MTDQTSALYVAIDGKGAATGAAEVNAALNSMKESAEKASSGIEGFKHVLELALGGELIKRAVEAAAQYSEKIEALGTISDEAVINIDALSDAAKRQAISFGQQPIAEATALYNIVKAGAKDSAQAMDLLTISNKLAVGGLTDVTTASKDLTSILLAYGPQAKSAQAVSDDLFVAMKDGRASIDELATALNRLGPQSQALGIPFSQMAAALSVVTRSGIDSQQAVFGLRSVLETIGAPTEHAKEVARGLGIDLGQAAVQSKGFSGVLAQISEKTGDSVSKLGALFGGVRMVVPILALMKNNGADLTKTLNDMAKAGGATQKAFEEMTKASPGFLLEQIKSAVEVGFIDAGKAIADVFVPSLQFVIENLDGIKKAAELAMVAVAALAAVRFSLMVEEFFAAGTAMDYFGAALTKSQLLIRLLEAPLSTIKNLVGSITALALANPFVLAAAAIATVTAGLYIYSDQISISLGKTKEMGPATVSFGDIAHGVWDQIAKKSKSAYEEFKAAWSHVGPDISSFLGGALSVFIGVFAGWIETAIEYINKLIEGINSVAQHLGANAELVPKIDLAQLEKDFADYGKAAADMFHKGYKGITDSQIVQDIEEDAKKRAIARAAASKTNGGDGGDGGTLGAGGGGGGGTEYYDPNKDPRKVLIDLQRELKNETAAQGMNTDAHKDYIEVQKIEHELALKHITLSEAEQAQLAGNVTQLRLLQEQAAKPQPFYEWIKGLKDVGVAIQQDVVDGFKQAADATATFIRTGQGGFKSLGDIIDKVRDQITSLIIQEQIMGPILKASGLMSTNPAASGSATSGGSGFGGILGSLFGKMGGGGGTYTDGTMGPDGSQILWNMNALGNVFSKGKVTAFAGGGIVNSPTAFPMDGGTGLMGEAGPEAIMPLRRTPSGRLGVEVSTSSRNTSQPPGGPDNGSNAANAMRPIEVHYHISTPDIQSFHASSTQIMAQTQQALARADRRNN